MSAAQVRSDAPADSPSGTPITFDKAPVSRSSAARRLYRLLADGPAVPRLLALGASSLVLLLVIELTTGTAQPWESLLPGPALVAALVLLCLPRQVGMPWPLVLGGLALMLAGSLVAGLATALPVAFIVLAGLLAPFWSGRERAPLVGVAWAAGLVLLLLTASALLRWAGLALLEDRSALNMSLFVLCTGLLCAAPGWALAEAARRRPGRIARRVMVARSLLWRIGLGTALWVVAASQADPVARALWRLLAGSRIEAWAGPLAWIGSALFTAAGLVVVWRVPVWLARAQLRGKVAARAATDACVTGGIGGLLMGLVWQSLGASNASVGSGSGLWNAPTGNSDDLHLSLAVLLSLLVHVLVRLLLGAPLRGQARPLWICLPPAAAATSTPMSAPTSARDETLRRAGLLAAAWRLGPVTLVASRDDAPGLSGAHGVLAQEAGVGEGLFLPLQAGDGWLRDLPDAAQWSALPVREHYLAPGLASGWAEVVARLPADAEVCVITAAASSRMGDPVHALCAALPAARSAVWQSTPPPTAPAAGHGTPRLALPFAGLPCSHTAAAPGSEALAWVQDRVGRSRDAARGRRRILLLHADHDAAFAGLLVQALRGRRDGRGQRVQASALGYAASATGPALAAARSTGFSHALLGDGELWGLLMADAVGLARRRAEARVQGSASASASPLGRVVDILLPGAWLLGWLGARLTWWTTALLAQARPLEVLVLESGLADAAQRAGLPRQSGAARMVSLCPCELPADAPAFYATPADHRLTLPPRSAWTDRLASTLAEDLLGQPLAPAQELAAGLTRGRGAAAPGPDDSVPSA